MTHPPAEMWMSYLYGEVPARAKAGLKRHLASCTQCRESVVSWQATMTGLNRWKIETLDAGVRRAPAAPILKWALAALVVLGIGVGIGRVSAPAPDMEAIRAAVEQPLRIALAAELKLQVRDAVVADFQAALSGRPADLQSEPRRQLRLAADRWTARAVAESTAESQRLLLELAQDVQSSREQDQATLMALFQRAERERQADFLSLRRAVETVAVVADDKFNRTESQLGEFVSYVQARSLRDGVGELANP